MIELVYKSSILSNGAPNFPPVYGSGNPLLGAGLAGAGDQNNDGFPDMLAGIPGAGDIGEGAVRWMELGEGPASQGVRVRALGATASIGVAQLGTDVM